MSGASTALVMLALMAAVELAPDSPVAALGSAAQRGCYEIQVQEGTKVAGVDGVDLVATVTTTSTRTICEGDGADNPTAASGGGDGGALRCTYDPMGPVETVRAVIDAVNARQQAVVDSPQITTDIYLSPDPRFADVVERTTWYRVQGGSAQVLHIVRCPGQLSETQWLTMYPDGTTLVPQVRAIDLVPGLQARVTRQLPTPVPRIGPADTNPNGWTFVQHPTFFWLDQRTGQWETVSATASAGSVSVTVSAEPVRLVVDPGDGSAKVTCNGPPPAVTVQNYGTVRACSHSYRNSSAMAANGESYPVTTAIVWHVSWTANTGESGDLGFLSTTSPTRMLQVAEIQAIVTDGASG